MPNEKPVEYLLPEWAQSFEQLLRDLTDGEAAFYVFFLEYGLEILSAIIVAIVAWLWKKFRNKNKHIEAKTSPVIIINNASKSEQTTPAKPTDRKPQKSKNIAIGHLPNVPGEFYGRTQELALLTQAIQPNAKTRIVQLIAAGGTGKTKLLRHWLNENAPAVPNRIIWSFYSQGTTKAKQISLAPLFDDAFKNFGINQSTLNTKEEKADKLVELLTQHRCLLVLDGLEPMQHLEGMLKDKTLLRILRKLLNQQAARCVITSRIKVYELYQQYGDKVITHDLHNLSLEDAVKLLQSLDVEGRVPQLEAAANEYACHALAIHLLGKVLAGRYQGDVQKRDLIRALPINPQGEHINRHAFRVMQAYQDWFADKPELAVLYLLGLFDQPIETAVLEQLQQAQIPALTQNLTKEDLHQAIYNLRENTQIVPQHPEHQDLVDCHPLIREYFGQQLKQNQPEAYKAAHQTLYEYYKALPKQPQPDKREDLHPLFAAVAHGCAAGLHQQALDEVYWPRIQRGGEAYNVKKLGAFGSDLAIIAHFFEEPWQKPETTLKPNAQAAVLKWSGRDLLALGRLQEASKQTEAGMKMSARQKDWKEAAQGANNLSELKLALGDIEGAIAIAKCSKKYARQSSDIFWQIEARTVQANALNQAGEIPKAEALFQKAERLFQNSVSFQTLLKLETFDQATKQRQYLSHSLHSEQGFRYCDLLLRQAGVDKKILEKVLGRTEYSIEISERNKWLLGIALDQLTQARVYLQLALADQSQPNPLEQNENLSQAKNWLEKAVPALQKAGQDHFLPLGLLTRAAWYRLKQDFAKAQQDLQEVYDIAEPSGMRLHLTDYHLESVHLGLAADWPQDKIQTHLQAAAGLIEQTGYHRRDAELAGLQNQINRG